MVHLGCYVKKNSDGAQMVQVVGGVELWWLKWTKILSHSGPKFPPSFHDNGALNFVPE